MKSDYVQKNNAAFALQLRTFQDNIGSYATLLGLTPAQVTSQAADSDYYNYLVEVLQTMEQHGQQWSMWHRQMRHGSTALPGGAPVLPTLPVAPTAVPPGIEGRFRALMNLIKAGPNYNTSIGEALGGEGPEQTAPDTAAIKPDLTLRLSGGSVQVGWGWGGQSKHLDMIRLEVDRGGGAGFVLLAMDTTPNYIDTEPLPATAAKWTYRGMYYVGDSPVGQWSDPVSINVGA
jgi:hypothetical protein